MDNIEDIIQKHFSDSPKPNLSVRANHILKRTFDIAASSFSIVILAPVIGMLAIATLYDNGSPIFFKQQRLGYRGKMITIKKIRTMHNGIEAKVRNGEIYTTTKYHSIPYDSPVYTRLGRILDYIHINESPQLWNVLRGEMSMVGNRPIQRHTAAKLMDEPGFIERFDSKPGLVGYVQLVGRGSTTEEYVRLEREYSKSYTSSRCFAEDLNIIYKTLKMYATQIFNKTHYSKTAKNTHS